MTGFDGIRERAAARKGGEAALEALLETVEVRSPEELAALPDDRILSEFSKRVFQAGFNWQVVENKWNDFETAFERFDIARNVFMSDDDLDRHLANKAIIRHGTKIVSIRENAAFLSDLAREHGSAANAIAQWPVDDHIGLIALLKTRGSRLGGMTGQYALRFLGKESFVLSRDVVTALIGAGVIDKAPTSKAGLAATQAAFSRWRDETGLSLTHLSRILAMSVG